MEASRRITTSSGRSSLLLLHDGEDQTVESNESVFTHYNSLCGLIPCSEAKYTLAHLHTVVC